MKQVFFLLLLFSSSILSAQTLADYEEVVYLKNGSIIRGVIIEQIPGKSLKIQTKDRNVFVYQMDEIEKIAKEVIPGNAGGSHSDNRKAKGFELYIDEGIAVWVPNDPYPTNMITVTPGYKFNRYVFLGLSTGLIARKGFVSVPAFVDLRLTLTKTKVAPLMQLNVGYMCPNLVSGYDYFSYADVSEYGGFLFGIKPGVGINLKKNIDLNFYTGYQMGSQITNVSYYGSDDTNYNLMHFFTLTAGVKF
jgi:hypothetical protein